MLLEVSHLTSGYRGVPAIRGVDLRAERGEIVALLGSNGAGKTTLILTLAGLLRPISGTVLLDGEPITGIAAHRLARRGLAVVTDDRVLLPSLTVRENLALVRGAKSDPVELFPELAPLLDRRAGLLSGGEQQMLALGRALCVHPKLMLVDELSQGLAPVVARRCLDGLADAAVRLGMGVVLVEQNVRAALAIAERVCVLAHGQVVLDDLAERHRDDIRLVESRYMGHGSDGLERVGNLGTHFDLAT